MNSIRKHVPSFFEDFETPTVEFDGLSGLMAVDFVKSWASGKGFHKFSFGGDCLMAEVNGGHEWWVVGYLKEPVEGLPEWKTPAVWKTKKSPSD